MQTTIEKICIMMDFLDKYVFKIPHHNLPMPPEIVDDSRPEKTFHFYKYSKTMNYQGWASSGGLYKSVAVSGIIPNSQWADRIYIFLKQEVEDKISRMEKESNMKSIRHIVFNFNKLDFLK